MRKVDFYCTFCGRQCIETIDYVDGTGSIVWKCPMRREWFVFLPRYEQHFRRYVGTAEPKFDAVTGKPHATKS